MAWQDKRSEVGWNRQSEDRMVGGYIQLKVEGSKDKEGEKNGRLGGHY